MKKKISLKDIAETVGVSTATVSYVLSKGQENRVSPGMAAKIKQVAKELNYQPNQIAKSLKSGKTFTIGLIVADISNPFFANIARIIEDEAKKQDYTVIFGSSDESADKSRDLIRFLSNRQVDGFIIAPTENSMDQIEQLKAQNIPFVLIDRYFPEIQSSYVVINNYQAAYQAISRLTDMGHTKIGVISYSNGLFHMKERVRGYKQAIRDHGFEYKKSWMKEVNYATAKKEVEAAIDQLLNKKKEVTALFFATNTLAVHGLKYIDRLQLKVPDDVAVVCFDQGEAFDFYYCPLTYVKQPLVELGTAAVNILIDQMSRKTKGYSQTSLEAELIVRDSCSKLDKQLNV